MTDTEIIKAFENCCLTCGCSECYYAEKGSDDCLKEMKSDILDLINRLKAEIERVTDNFNCQQTVYADLSKIIKDQSEELKTAKADAYKEFAERLKEKAHQCFMGGDDAVNVSNIDKLLREMETENEKKVK